MASQQTLNELRDIADGKVPIEDSLKSPTDMQLEEEGWTEDDSLAAADKYWSSLMLGWGDEMSLWTSAIKQGVSTDTNPSEIYAQLRKDYDARQEAFEQRHPEAYLAADVGGALTSPVNFIPGFGQVITGARIASTAPKVAKAAQIAAPVVRGGVESAIYGAGEAEAGQRLEQAKEYGLTGAALTAGLRTAGSVVAKPVVDLFTKRKIKHNLVDKDGNFTPITLAVGSKDTSASESFLGSLYRDIIAPSWGAKGVYSGQEKKVIEAKEKMLADQKKLMENITDQAKISSAVNKAKLKQGIQTKKDQWKNIAKKYTEASERHTNPLEVALKALQKENESNPFFKDALETTKQDIAAMRFAFRENKFTSGLPAGHSAKDLERLVSLTQPHSKIRYLDYLWTEKGYSMIKGKTIRIKSGEFEESLTKAINDDPVFSVNIANLPAFQKEVKSVIQNLVDFKDKNARIDGDVMANIRSRLGTIASKTGDPQMQRALREVQSKVDDIIIKNLTGKQKIAFAKEHRNWKNLMLLRDSVSSASDLKKLGQFDETDWVNAVNKNSKYDKRYGLERQDALTLQKNIEKTQKDNAALARKGAETDANRIHALLVKEKERLKNKLNKEEPKFLGEAIRRREAQIGGQKNKISSLTANSETAKRYLFLEQELKTLQELRSGKPSWFHTMAAFGILTQAATQVAAGGYPVAVPLALSASRGLATKPAQKFMAGQTSGQEAIQRMINADKTKMTADMLSKSLPRPIQTSLEQEEQQQAKAQAQTPQYLRYLNTR